GLSKIEFPWFLQSIPATHITLKKFTNSMSILSFCYWPLPCITVKTAVLGIVMYTPQQRML
ncbi:hypothetical protein, partial [Pseudoalteromonas sp. S326]|uniref:hypothetical protein n=1 Tax=Pseudoalteromonas sp. S326 TaxID=579533 RepID=UPI001BB23B59